MNCPTCGCTFYDGCPDKYCQCDNPVWGVVAHKKYDDSNCTLHKFLPLRGCTRCNKWEGPPVMVTRKEYPEEYEKFWEENEDLEKPE